MGVLCPLVLLAGLSLVVAQSSTPGAAPSDPSITAISVLGTVTEIKSDLRQVIVTTAAGNQVTVTLSDATEFMRIPPGEKTKDKFIKITSADFGLGDSVFARGRMSEDRKAMPAREFYVMSKGDIAQKRDRDREQWRTRGISGTVASLNPDTKEITVDSRTGDGLKSIVIGASGDTRFRRYAPDSVLFSDAKPSSFAELKTGDQLRALGTRSADGNRFNPEEIVFGSFQTLGGTITEVDAAKNEIKINDPKSKEPITVMISKDSVMRRLTPELLSALVPQTAVAASGSSPAATKPAPKKPEELQEAFDQLPIVKLEELKAGEAILVSSTKGAEANRITAIAIVTGAGPLLQNNPASRGAAVSLGAMSLGGP
jgi:preprotein translocase subunit YajC